MWRLAEPEEEPFEGKARQDKIEALAACLGELQQAGARRRAYILELLSHWR